MARIDESTQSDPSERTRFAGGDVAIKMSDHALGQIVGLDLVGHRQGLQFWHQAPVTADDPFDQTLVPQVVQPPVLAVALTGGVNQRQVARFIERGRVGAGIRRQMERLDGAGDVLGEAGADEAAGGDRVAGANQAHGLAGADDLAAFGDVQQSEQGMQHVGFPS